MDGFFDAADDLLDSIQTKKTKTPVKRPHESSNSQSTSNNDDLIQKTGGPVEKKMKYDLFL